MPSWDGRSHRFAEVLVPFGSPVAILMIYHDAWPGLRIEGKPQCHIVAIAKESNEIAVSVGCMLSRTRTGMGADELTVALPGDMAAQFLDTLEGAAGTDARVAEYAAIDSERFI